MDGAITGAAPTAWCSREARQRWSSPGGFNALLVVLVLSLLPRGARAEEGRDAAVPAAGDRLALPHAAYFELLGKNGLYGLGYDFALTDWLGLGPSAAYYTVESERIFSIAPYVNLYPVTGRWGAVLVQAGAQLVHVSVPSEVAGWSGTSTNGGAGLVSVGYEHRGTFLFRFLVSGVFGAGGVFPWTGVALGAAW